MSTLVNPTLIDLDQFFLFIGSSLLHKKEIMAQVDFNNLTERANANLEFLKTNVAGLENDALDYKPREGKWSVNEVVGHLNQVYRIYFPLFSKALERTSPSELQVDEIVKRKRTLLGCLSIYSMKPTNKKIRFKMKTFDFFEPLDNEGSDELKLFEENHLHFIQLISKLSELQIADVKMGTSLGEKVKFYIHEAVEFLIAHEERHMVQIANVLAHKSQK